MFLGGIKVLIFPAMIILALSVVTADCYAKKLGSRGLFAFGNQNDDVQYQQRLMVTPKNREPLALALRYREAAGKKAFQSIQTAGDYLPKKVGITEKFTVTNLQNATTREVEAVLIHVSDTTFWYLDVNLPQDKGLFKNTAEVWEQEIRPKISELFGELRSPEADQGNRITVLNTTLNGAAGYFSSVDSYPKWVHPSSNEREIIFMDPRKAPLSSERYLAVLTHEYQHAIHNRYDPGEESWVNEGLSELAVELIGFENSLKKYHLKKPSVQLNYWSQQPSDALYHYAASSSFFSFLINQNIATSTLFELVMEQEDGVKGINNWLSQYDSNFEKEFTDWIVSNYQYDQGIKEISGPEYRKNVRFEVPQYGALYLDLEQFRGKSMSFDGDVWVQRFEDKCPEVCWWSNTGDSINTALTLKADLTSTKQPVATFRMWHDIEPDWDYLYFSISVDGGVTWSTLEEDAKTTTFNPSGSNFGHAYTGKDEWSEHDVNLAEYSGQEVLLRFEYVTDDAVNLSGVLLEQFKIKGTDISLNPESSGWNSEGFILVNNVLPQRFIVRLVEFYFDGTTTTYEVPLDNNNEISFEVREKDDKVRKVGLIVAGATLHTYQPAGFNLIYPD